MLGVPTRHQPVVQQILYFQAHHPQCLLAVEPVGVAGIGELAGLPSSIAARAAATI
jgi:hypothetical protein